MSARNILYVTRWMPTLSGGGGEIRATNDFLALTGLGRVHILYVGESTTKLAASLAAQAASVTRARDVMNAHPALFRIVRRPTLVDKLFRRAWGIGGPTFRLSDADTNAVVAALPGVRFDAVIALHLCCAVWIDRVADVLAIPSALRMIDW